MGFFNTAQAPTIKFNEVGANVTGVVRSITQDVQIGFDDNNRPTGPRLDASGNPVLGTTITIVDDEGNLGKIRVGDTIYTDASGKPSGIELTSGLKAAITEAIFDAGQRDLEIGDTITIAYIGDGDAVNGRTAPKVYHAEIVKSTKG